MKPKQFRNVVFAVGTLFLVGDLVAQNQPTVRATVACWKAKPNRLPELEGLFLDVGQKLFQSYVDTKRVQGWTLSRAVAPTGTETRCDLISTAFFPGIPSEPSDQFAEDLKRAGVTMPLPELMTKVGELGWLLSSEHYVRYAGFGSAEKGDYWQANLMKTPPGGGADFRAWERDVWAPIANVAAASGHPRKAWSGWWRVYPAGAGEPYNAVTVDIFRDWESVWSPRRFSEEEVQKAFPGMTFQQVMSNVGELRSLVRRDLYVVIARIGGAGSER